MSILSYLPSHGKLVRTLWLLALAGLALYAAFTLHLCLLAIAYPYQLDYGEGLVLHQARLLAAGQSIYKHLDSYPYIFANYPPLFQALVAPLLSISGTSFAPGRLLALGATLGLALVLYGLVRQAGGRRLAAAVAALFFLGSPYVYHWAPLLRIDLPALFFTALGVLVLGRSAAAGHSFHREETTRAQGRSAASTSQRLACVAAVLFVLALFTKQSYLAGPAAALVYLALNDRMTLRRFALVGLVVGLAPFIAIEAATAGAFSFGLFTANVNPFSLSLLAGQLRSFALTFCVLILLSLGIAVASVRRGAGVSLARVPLLAWYIAFAVATVVLAGKVGAWENYFFEALLALCVGAGLGLDALLRSRRRALQAAAPLLVIVQLALMWHDPRIGVRVIEEDGAANRALAPLIAQQTGMILSEDLGLLLVNGQEIPYFSFEYAQLARVGKWDQHWELDALRNGRFALVVLEKGTREDPDRYQRFTKEVLSAIDSAYGLMAEVGKYRIYSPQPPARQTDALFGDVIRLRGYRIDAAAASDDLTAPPAAPSRTAFNPSPQGLRLTLLWQAEAAVAASYTVFAHLEDAAGVRRGQSDGIPLFGLYATDRWAAQEIVRDYQDITLPAGLPPGRYTLRVGLYDAVSGERLALADGRNSLVLAAVTLGADPPHPFPAPAHTFTNGIALGAIALSSRTVQPGAALSVTLSWQTDRYVDMDATVFVHLAGSDGRPVAQSDAPPQNGAYPTSLWNPGERIDDAHVVPVPPTLAPGVYRLIVGLYDQATERRVPLTTGADSVDLGEIIVVK